MFVDPCIIVQLIRKNPTRCNNVSKFYYSIFIWSSTCFGRHTAHHQEPKTALAASGLSYVEGCWTCSWWTLSGTVCLCLYKLVTDVSTKHCGLIFKGRNVQEECSSCQQTIRVSNMNQSKKSCDLSNSKISFLGQIWGKLHFCNIATPSQVKTWIDSFVTYFKVGVWQWKIYSIKLSLYFW